MEFSKLITSIVTGFWILLIIVSGALMVKINVDISYLIGYVQPVVLTMVGAYSMKAGVENYAKISNSSTGVGDPSIQMNQTKEDMRDKV
jgi:hypothetical protein